MSRLLCFGRYERKGQLLEAFALWLRVLDRKDPAGGSAALSEDRFYR
jgi:hypothetical protein